MKTKIHRYGNQTGKSLVILAVALILLIGQSVFFLYQANEIRDREAQQEKAGLILLRLREVFADLQDAETGQRGYLLTSTEAYLQPYRRASTAVAEHMGAARSLLASDALLTAQLESLQPVIDLKMGELDETVRLQSSGNHEAAVNRLRDGSGKRYMDEARAILGKLMDEVRSSRTDTSQEVTSLARTAGYVLASIALTIVIMVGVATTQMLRVIRKNEELTKRLADESTHDELTGLPNRRLFYTWLDKALDQAARKRSKISVLFIDLDGFKEINDSHGHEAGDAVLRGVTGRFSQVLRSADLLTRFGGDEFAVVVSDAPSREGLAILAKRLLDALCAPLLPHLSDKSIGASIGIAVFPEHGSSLDGLIKAADKAMYEAKRTGKGNFCFAADTA